MYFAVEKKKKNKKKKIIMSEDAQRIASYTAHFDDRIPQ